MSATDHEFSETDEGKTVVASDGTDLGIVRDVRTGAAFVEPMASLEPPLRAQLGWGGDDRDVYRLDASRVDAITNDTVRLLEP